MEITPFVEQICASEYTHELRWASGMFYWMDQVQTYKTNRFDFIGRIDMHAKEIARGADLDEDLILDVGCILKTGTTECRSNREDVIDLFYKVWAVIGSFNLPTQSPTMSSRPSASPTEYPTGKACLDFDCHLYVGFPFSHTRHCLTQALRSKRRLLLRPRPHLLHWLLMCLIPPHETT